MARTTLYLVRHAEQDRDSTAGGLSPRGRQQARLLGQRLQEVPLDGMHVSPLPRAVETAELVAGYLPEVPRHTCDRVADRTPVPSPGFQRRRAPAAGAAVARGGHPAAGLHDQQAGRPG